MRALLIVGAVLTWILHVAGSSSLPPGWSVHYEKDTDRPYFYNRETGVSSWEQPEYEPAIDDRYRVDSQSESAEQQWDQNPVASQTAVSEADDRAENQPDAADTAYSPDFYFESDVYAPAVTDDEPAQEEQDAASLQQRALAESGSADVFYDVTAADDTETAQHVAEWSADYMPAPAPTPVAAIAPTSVTARSSSGVESIAQIRLDATLNALEAAQAECASLRTRTTAAEATASNASSIAQLLQTKLADCESRAAVLEAAANSTSANVTALVREAEQVSHACCSLIKLMRPAIASTLFYASVVATRCITHVMLWFCCHRAPTHMQYALLMLLPGQSHYDQTEQAALCSQAELHSSSGGQSSSGSAGS